MTTSCPLRVLSSRLETFKFQEILDITPLNAFFVYSPFVFLYLICSTPSAQGKKGLPLPHLDNVQYVDPELDIMTVMFSFILVK